MSMQCEESVTLQTMYQLLINMASRMDTVAGDVHQLKTDVQTIKDCNTNATSGTTSSSGLRIPCPLRCGADFKKVSDNGQLQLSAPLLILPTGKLLVGSFVQSYQD